MAERKRIYLCLAHMSEDGMETDAQAAGVLSYK